MGEAKTTKEKKKKQEVSRSHHRRMEHAGEWGTDGDCNALETNEPAINETAPLLLLLVVVIGRTPVCASGKWRRWCLAFSFLIPNYAPFPRSHLSPRKLPKKMMHFLRCWWQGVRKRWDSDANRLPTTVFWDEDGPGTSAGSSKHTMCRKTRDARRAIFSDTLGTLGVC